MVARSAIPHAVLTDPVAAAGQLFGHDHWSGAEAIIRSVFTPYSRTAVKGCHASGKTFATSDVILLALLLGGDVVTTAPTDDQVRGQLWRTVNATVRATQASGRVPPGCWGDVNQTEVRVPSGARAWGRATNQGVRFQGEHARPGSFLIVIADECPGVLADVLGAIEGIRAGGDVRVLILGNPLEAAGPFYEAFHPASGSPSAWTTHTISAFDTPNLDGLTIDDVRAMSPEALDQNVRPYLITRRYVKEKYESWGPEHWEYQARVLARFPDQTAEALIALSWLEAAQRRRPSAAAGTRLVAGLDVAGPGEAQTVLAIRRGPDVVHSRAWTSSDPRAEVIAELKTWVHRGLAVVNVDSVGIGYYVYRDLDEHLRPLGVAVRSVNVGMPSAELDDKGDKRYANLKAEYYWHLREQFADGLVSGLPAEAAAQLRTIRYAHPKGVVTIESKADAVSRGVSSPDWAEATMLCWAPTDADADLASLYRASIAMRVR